MTIEQEAVYVTSTSGEPRGIELIDETFEPSGLVVTVSGELDVATTPALRDHLDAALEAGTRRLVIDLCELSFLDSIALAAIVQARRRLPEGGRMALAVDPSSYVMLVLESTGLTQQLDLVMTRAQALEHVSG